MKHILSFLCIITACTSFLTTQETSSTIKIALDDANLVRTGFMCSYADLSASVFTAHTQEFSQLKNWYIKKNSNSYVSWVFGTLSFQGITSYAKNPDFTVKTTALPKKTLTSTNIDPVLPGIRSSSMKPSALVSLKIPVAVFFKPSLSFLYTTQDSQGLHADNTLAVSLNFPFSFNKLSFSTSFTAFNYDRKMNSGDTWYKTMPHTGEGRYFLFANASTLKFPFLQLQSLTGMSEISKSQWKYNNRSECIITIPVRASNISILGFFFMSDIDFLSLNNDREKTVLHASINPQFTFPLNSKKTWKLAIGILADYQKKFTDAIPSLEEKKNSMAASINLKHSMMLTDITVSADNLTVQTFLSSITNINYAINAKINVDRFTILPVTISGFFKHSFIPLSMQQNHAYALNGRVSFKPVTKSSFAFSAEYQCDFKDITKMIDSFTITSDVAFSTFQISGSYKQNCTTQKHSFSAGLSYRMSGLY